MDSDLKVTACAVVQLSPHSKQVLVAGLQFTPLMACMYRTISEDLPLKEL